MAANGERWQDGDTGLVVVVPSGEKTARRLQVVLALTLPVLADPDRQLYDALGLRRLLLGTLQVSATAVIDRAGTVRYLRAQANPGQAFDLAELEAALARLA